MSTITCNTLKFAQRLEKAGATREYAVAEAEALSEVFETGTQELSTKGDLREMEMRINGQMREMRSDIIGEMKLMRWMIGLSLALSTGILVLLAKLFISL